MSQKRPSHELELDGRYVFLTSLAEDRRVLDMGGSARALLTLAEAGTAELTHCGDDAETVQKALSDAGVEGVEVRGMVELPLPFADQAFDLIIYHDLAEELGRDDKWVAELRRVLDPGGYLVLALKNAEGKLVSDLAGERFTAPFTYQDAFAKLSPSFGVLTLMGQSPVVANLFYDFESNTDEPGLVFDRSLLTEESEEAGWYVLIFGPEAVHRDDLTIVQAPYQEVLAAVAAARAAPAASAEPSPDAARLAELEELVERFRRDRDVLASRLAQQDEAAGAGQEAVEARADGDGEELVALTEQNAQLSEAVNQARERAESAVQDLVTEREAGAEMQRKIEELSSALDELRGELAATNERVSLAEAERDEARRRLDAEDEDSGQETAGTSQRVEELEAEAVRQAKVRQSFETQIRDLLEEVGQLREAEEKLRTELAATREGAAGGSDEAQAMRKERDELAALLDQAQRKWDQQAEELRLEADALRSRSEQARQDWEAQLTELQGERDAVRAELAASAGQERAAPAAEELVRLREKLLSLEGEKEALVGEVRRLGEQARAGGAARPSQDAVGRPLESSLEEIEDLIATSVPTRR